MPIAGPGTGDRRPEYKKAELASTRVATTPGRRQADDYPARWPCATACARRPGREQRLLGQDELAAIGAAEHSDPEPARIEGPFTTAREVDLLGRSAKDLEVSARWASSSRSAPEIRTIRLA